MTSKPVEARSLRVLIVEDCEPDAVLLDRALQRGGFRPECLRVDSADSMRQALNEPWDVILADHSMPHFSAPAALAIVQERGLDIPFIIVSGQIDEETAVAAMRAGAHDYIMKERLARLVPAVERELREAEVRRARKNSEEDLRRAHEELEIRVERRTADLRQANVKLQNVLEERRRLENELLEIAENERRRIGFDLHDDLGQKLTGASLMVKGLEQRLSSESHSCVREVGEIRNLINQIIDHTHNLAHQFGSLDVTGDDLPGVLGDLAANVRNMFGISCACTINGVVPDLPEDTTMQLYKIAQEAVSNAIKHGKAQEVAIEVSKERDRLTMRIVNDGLLFAPPTEAKARMGLRIMNYRANTVGASFEVGPGERAGTVVTCGLLVRNLSKNGLRPRSRLEETSPLPCKTKSI